MASVESQEWYSGYQHQVPHDAEFGSSGSFGGLNYDGRIQAAIGRAERELLQIRSLLSWWCRVRHNVQEQNLRCCQDQDVCKNVVSDKNFLNP